jgi:hypothetical protein
LIKVKQANTFFTELDQFFQSRGPSQAVTLRTGYGRAGTRAKTADFHVVKAAPFAGDSALFQRPLWEDSVFFT